MLLYKAYINKQMETSGLAWTLRKAIPACQRRAGQNSHSFKMGLTINIPLPQKLPEDKIWDQFFHPSTVRSLTAPWKRCFGHNESQQGHGASGISPPVFPRSPQGVEASHGWLIARGSSSREWNLISHEKKKEI